MCVGVVLKAVKRMISNLCASGNHAIYYVTMIINQHFPHEYPASRSLGTDKLYVRLNESRQKFLDSTELLNSWHWMNVRQLELYVTAAGQQKCVQKLDQMQYRRSYGWCLWAVKLRSFWQSNMNFDWTCCRRARRICEMAFVLRRLITKKWITIDSQPMVRLSSTKRLINACRFVQKLIITASQFCSFCIYTKANIYITVGVGNDTLQQRQKCVRTIWWADTGRHLLFGRYIWNRCVRWSF